VPVNKDLGPIHAENYFWAKILDNYRPYGHRSGHGDVACDLYCDIFNYNVYGFRKHPTGQDIYTLEGYPDGTWYKIIFNQSREMLADILSKDQSDEG
jgi:hypothetical protein